jgi:hypothetical protein
MARGYVRRFDWDEDDTEATIYLSTRLRVRLTDLDRNPLPHARCRVIGDEETIYEGDQDGVVKIPLAPNCESVELEWEPQQAGESEDDDRFMWSHVCWVGIESMDDEMCAERLTHLGFDGASLEEQVEAYQRYFGEEPTGKVSDIRDELVEWHDAGTRPAQASGGTEVAAPSDAQAPVPGDPDGSDSTS